MSSAAFRLILLVSCAHALVHAYELSLPSVEQDIAEEFLGDDEQAGKKFTGVLQNYWRLLWGTGALLAGLLVDRLGSRSMLAVYLVGCGLACLLAGMASSQGQLLTTMILMGAFAAIYHPAGLALISHETTDEARPKALGIHGIFGSLGIGLAPMIAWAMSTAGFQWRQFYWTLAIPGMLLGAYFFASLRRVPEPHSKNSAKSNKPDDNADWTSYGILTVFSFLQGFVYSALLSFLPRYLSGSGIEIFQTSEQSTGKLFASIVLWVGCVGQYIAGRFARHRILELQLAIITFGNVPFLCWMALASTWDRVVAAALLALVHFMQQPVYNSLIAKYSPAKHRSLCYGVSFAMAFGLGSFGSRFAGSMQSDLYVYGLLAGLAAMGGVIGLVLWMFNRENVE